MDEFGLSQNTVQKPNILSMPTEFSVLTDDEKQLMYDAIPLITILVAGADGNMDEQELEWAEKITKIRSFDYHNVLNPYYQLVGEHFSNRFQHFNSTLPEGTEARQEAISGKLSNINDIFGKLETDRAKLYYESFRSFGEHVAKASGGFLRFMSVSSAEAAVKDLPMLVEPVVEEGEENSEENE